MLRLLLRIGPATDNTTTTAATTSTSTLRRLRQPIKLRVLPRHLLEPDLPAKGALVEHPKPERLLPTGGPPRRRISGTPEHYHAASSNNSMAAIVAMARELDI